MKYSLPFYTTNPYLKQVDEISIRYDEFCEPSLMDFLDEHIGQRVVLRIARDNKMTAKNYQFLQAIVKQYAEGAVVLRFESLDDSGVKYGLPHFFYYYCNDIEQAIELEKQGVTDVYITGNLCYWLPELRRRLHCNIRVYPNIAQSSIDCSDPYTKFFIRPEDVKLFEPYIDYFEFYTEDCTRAADLYRIYHINKYYEGRLEMLITGFPQFLIHNECLDQGLAAEKLYCHKNCIYGSNCQTCKKWFNLAQSLYNNKYTISLQKDKSE